MQSSVGLLSAVRLSSGLLFWPPAYVVEGGIRCGQTEADTVVDLIQALNCSSHLKLWDPRIIAERGVFSCGGSGQWRQGGKMGANLGRDAEIRCCGLVKQTLQAAVPFDPGRELW